MSRKQSKAAARPAPSEPIPNSSPRWWWYALGIFLALFAAFEVYGPAVRGPFLFDDRFLPFMLPDFAQSPLRSWMSGVRPLLMLGYWVNYQWNQLDPYWYHVVNVLLHFSNAVFAWLIVRRILDWAGVPRDRAVVLSLFGGLLFLLHPLQTESVTYVASRSESQSVFFFSAAFVVFLYRRRIAVSVRVALAVLLLFGAACLTKEHAAVLPALLLLTDYFWNPGFSFEGIRRNWKLYVPIALGGLAAVAYVWRILSGASTAGFGMKDLTWYQYLFSQCRAIWVYVRLFFVPYGLNVDHDFPVSHGILDHGAVIGFIALAALAVAAWMWRREYPLAGYGWLAFLLLLAPTSSVVPIRDLLVERRVYLAFVPLVLICCEGLRRWRTSTANLAATLAAVVCVFSFLTYQRNVVWADSISLWQDTAEKSPAKYRPHFQLAYAYYQQGRCADAAREYGRAAQIEKADYSLLIDWGQAYDCAQQPQAAIEKFRQAAALEPTAHVYSQIAMVYAKRNQRPEAFQALNDAERLDARYAMIYVYRGNLYLLSREFDLAREQFQKALALNPPDQTTQSAARNGLDMAQRRFTPSLQ